MDELLAALASFAPLTLAPVLLLLLAPHAGRRSRAAFAAVLVLAAGGLAVLAATKTGSAGRLEVINPFMNPEVGRPVPFVVDTVAAPGWAWPVAASLLLLVAAAGLVLGRRRPVGAPRPVRYALAVTAWTLAARLVLEKTAAPEGLTWAIGLTVPMLLVLPFFAAWQGWRGASFWRWLAALAVLASIQRAALVGLAWLATSRGLGTHLDVTAIREVTLPSGHHRFAAGDQAFAQWWTLMLVPQLVLWVPITVIAGLLLGAVPFAVARARRRATGPAPGAP